MSLWNRIFGKKDPARQPESSVPAAPGAAPSGLSGPWKARPIFISSTFKDMQSERDHLCRYVFPRLEEELRNRRHQIEPIDLRLGVETAQLGTEEARELLVLKVCLNEIQRSRPFLLVVLGDRYGWVPPEDRMSAATQEAGFKTEVRGKSVTALEIEFGVLKEHPEQRRRSFFYLRDPLPYEKMSPAVAADYSDAHSPDPAVRARHAALQALKTQLAKDPELAPRVHSYHAHWDDKQNRVTGLEAWGEMVYQHLWRELEEETRVYAAQPPLTEDAQEHAALVEFVEHRRRGFTGREELLGRLLVLARSPAVPAGVAASDVAWGACLTGSPGSGKSAVFAELWHRLADDGAVLVLANAAGATPRGSQPDFMLRRFIQELADFLQIANPLPEKAGPDDVDQTLASLLARVAAKKRVVVLLDALDQFDPTPRGQHLTWLRPKQWPANARIIATALPCTGADALTQLAGIERPGLPPLTAADAAEIAKGVWQRYHRELSPDVLGVLTEKRLPDDAAACGNPLWLTLALEQLNLLDADDFARAERDFTGSPAQRLHAMMLDTAGRMPPGVPELYDWLLAYTEKAYGQAHARAFAAVIALGRFGWRETDLLPLVLRVAKMLFPGQPATALDDLHLATLRRGFRAHLARRGTAGQLDFFHAQMRQAVRQRALRDMKLVRQIHLAIADHLETLPVDDPLRETELMVHLIEGDDPARAARYYAGVQKPSAALTASTQTLADHILAATDQEANAAVDWTASLLAQPGLELPEVAALSDRFQIDLDNALQNKGRLGPRQRLLQATRAALERLAAANQDNGAWRWSLSTCRRQLGWLLEEQGLIDGALEEYKHSLAIREQLLQLPHSPASWREGLANIHVSLGNIFLAKNEYDSALARYRSAKEILKGLIGTDRTNASWHSTLSKCLGQEAAALERQDKYDEALELRRSSVQMDEFIVESFPDAIGFKADLSISSEKLASLLAAMGRNREALAELRKSLDICRRLAEADPDNNEWFEGVSYGHSKSGEILVRLGDFSGAIEELQTALTMAERLAGRDPMNAHWQSHLASCHLFLGIALDKLDRPGPANEAYERTRVLLLRMKSLGMHLNASEEEVLKRMEAHPPTDAALPSTPAPVRESAVNAAKHCCSIDRKAIENVDLRGILSVCEEAASEARRSSSYQPWRVLVFGYNDDPRELYDIPEVRRWCQSAISKAPFLPFILDTTTRQWFLFCVVETIRVPTTGQVAADPRTVIYLLQQGIISFGGFLRSANVSGFMEIARERGLAVMSELGLI